MIRYNERWTENKPGDPKALLDYYNAVYSQCPRAQQVGLPNLQPGMRARRGAPLRGAHYWGRL